MITVGLAYDLRDDYLVQGFSAEDAAEFDSPETIDAIEHALRAHAYETIRIGNVRSLVADLAAGKRWDIVFNFCEGVKGLAREAQVPALLEAYDIPFVFSGPEVMILTLDKALTKTVLRGHNVPTAPWFTINSAAETLSYKGPFPLFLKPVAEGSSKGISSRCLVNNPNELKISASYFLERYRQPVLAETYLTGREFTVGVLGSGEHTHVIGALELDAEKQPDIFGRSYANKDVDWTMPDIYKLAGDELAREACALAARAWRAVGGRDAGRIDIRCDAAGTPYILEINALPGLNPKKSDLPILAAMAGLPYTQLLGEIMARALARYGLNSEHLAARCA